MITPSPKDICTEIDWVIDNYFNQLVGLNRKAVIFSFAVCISCLFFFESITISVSWVDIAAIVVKSKIGALLPWLITGVFYLLQIRSLYYMGRGLNSPRLRKANLDKERNAQDVKCVEYLLTKLRIQPSVFNPFSLDYTGILLASSPIFFISLGTGFLRALRRQLRLLSEAVKISQDTSLTDFFGMLWNVYSYWDLIIWVVEFILILPYAFFLIELYYFIQHINGLETALLEEDRQTENKRALNVSMIFLGSVIIALSGSIIGEIAAPIMLYVRIIQF